MTLTPFKRRPIVMFDTHPQRRYAYSVAHIGDTGLESRNTSGIAATFAVFLCAKFQLFNVMSG